MPSSPTISRACGWRIRSAPIKPPGEFDALLETIAGLAAANVVMVETLHEHRILDKRHFAHAFGRALDGLAPEHRGGMIEHVLRNLRDRCMNLRSGVDSDAQAWLARLLERTGRE